MLFLAIGLALLTSAGALYLRINSEKGRTWERTEGMIDERFAFVFLPAFALALWGLAAISAANLSGEIPLLRALLFIIGVPIALVGAVGVIAGLFGVSYPQWLVPQWRRTSPYRKPVKRMRRRTRRGEGNSTPD